MHHCPVFYEKFTLQLETFNEILFLVMCYHMVLFSNLIWLPELKKSIGKSLVYMVFFLLGSNTLVIVLVSIKGCLRNKRLKFLKKRQAKELAKKDVVLGILEAAK